LPPPPSSPPLCAPHCPHLRPMKPSGRLSPTIFNPAARSSLLFKIVPESDILDLTCSACFCLRLVVYYPFSRLYLFSAETFLM
jgi:hypothetical protein